jgi:bifunctional non-homologous end joining protein LigD
VAIGRLAPSRVVLDGELVAIDTEGRPSFQALQHRATTGLALVYYAFDLLELDGEPGTSGAASEAGGKERSWIWI